MHVETPDERVVGIAAAIGERARARMLFGLSDGRSRTSTELAALAGVRPSTASVHLKRLTRARLVTVLAQGKHRYYSLNGTAVADALEGLSVLAGRAHDTFAPRTPTHLRAARTCYDHMAGSVAVALHDRLMSRGWLTMDPADGNGYGLTESGTVACTAIGIDVAAARAARRRFAFPCLDWSERRPHVGGALGKAVLALALKRRWVVRALDSRALRVTALGRRELRLRLGLDLDGL